MCIVCVFALPMASIGGFISNLQDTSELTASNLAWLRDDARNSKPLFCLEVFPLLDITVTSTVPDACHGTHLIEMSMSSVPEHDRPPALINALYVCLWLPVDGSASVSLFSSVNQPWSW